MKWNKDTLTNQPNDAAIENIVSELATIDVTHIAHATPLDVDSAYPASNNPSPRDALICYLKWCTMIHGEGVKVCQQLPPIVDWTIRREKRRRAFVASHDYSRRLDLYLPAPVF